MLRPLRPDHVPRCVCSVSVSGTATRPDGPAYGTDRGEIVRLLSLVVLVWLIIGAVAAGQRGYFSDSDQNCSSLATVAVTVVAGPLNYAGVNPEIECEVPQPSQ